MSSLGRGYAACLDTDDFLKILMKKLPTEHLRRDWCKKAGSLIAEDEHVSLRHFIEFVSKIGTQLNNTFAEELDAPKKIVATVTSESMNRPEKKITACLVCDQSHEIWNCPKFKEMPIQRRWDM